MRIAVLIITVFALCSQAFAQPADDVQVLDAIIGVVGDEIILLSDYEVQKAQFVAGEMGTAEEAECEVLEAILFEKLLLNQAKVDSIEVTEDRVQGELDRRINLFVQQLGSPEALETFYDKSLAEIRSEFHDAIEDQLRVQGMQQQITAGIRVTPSDVEDFYASIPQDSLPLIDSEVEISQVMIKPKPSEAAIDLVKSKLEKYREEVIGGEREFSTIALLYSEDTQTAARGGEIGKVGRGQLVSEFEQQAYNLDEGEMSRVFNTEYGYHIMQMMERSGEFFNARHILLKPKVSEADLNLAKTKLGEVKNLILTDSLTFGEAASIYSDDEGTSRNSGIIINPNTGSIRFPMKDLDPSLFLAIDKLEVDDMSAPAVMRSPQGDQAFRILKLRYRSEAHMANVGEDYQLLQDMTRSSFTDKALTEWLEKYISDTYIQLDDNMQDCTFTHDWLKKR